MAERPIVYEPHPVSPERKAELVAQGFRIVDAVYAPGYASVPQRLLEPALPPDEPADDQPLTTGKGPGGRWYVKRGKEIVAGPFKTEAEAEKAARR